MHARRVGAHRHSYPSALASVGAARRFAAAVLTAGGASDAVVDDCRLVISEMVANVVEHGDGTGLDVCVDLDVAAHWVVTVECAASTSASALSDSARWTLADPSHVSGRGLAIVRSLVDQIAITSTDGRLTFLCLLRRAAT